MTAPWNYRDPLEASLAAGVSGSTLMEHVHTIGAWERESGSPGEAKAYDYIGGYSPYDNVGARPYPAVLATGGLSDPRVTYWEPAKWAARLRPATTSGRPVLLKINMDAGHAGALGRFDHLKDPALAYAFAIWTMEREGKAR